MMVYKAAGLTLTGVNAMMVNIMGLNKRALKAGKPEFSDTPMRVRVDGFCGSLKRGSRPFSEFSDSVPRAGAGGFPEFSEAPTRVRSANYVEFVDAIKSEFSDTQHSTRTHAYLSGRGQGDNGTPFKR